MFFYYRISDKSYLKEKLPGVGKRECLTNFLEVFGETSGMIVADNCKDDTLEMVRAVVGDRRIYISDLGNAGSLRWCIDHAIQHQEGAVYFVEDDYLHLPKARSIVYEGFRLNHEVSYVTLYDHPDKYSSAYGHGETSKVYRGANSHWRETQSTCMTFLAYSDVLKDDYEIWEKHTENFHPNDHQIFTDILTQKGGKLVCAIPGAATHTDLNTSIALNQVTIEPWAIEIACDSLIYKAKQAKDRGSIATFNTIMNTTESNSWDRIKLLNAFLHSGVLFS